MFVRDEERSYRTMFVVLGLSFAAVTIWAIADEVWVRRPWKEHQTTDSGGIRQIVVPELGVIDRCTTCHQGADDPSAGGDATPLLAAHPRRDELFGAHPPHRFGCTPCHGGQGLALTEGTAHGHSDPSWSNDLVPMVAVEARCLWCHRADDALPGAPTLTRGRAVLREAGCAGCHETGLPEDAADKRGPSLSHVGSKLRPGALAAWIADPAPRRRAHRMPQMWPGAGELGDLADVAAREARAIAAYLVQASLPLSAGGKWSSAEWPARPELVQQGRRLFDRVGCRGCHQIGVPELDAVTLRAERPAEPGGNDDFAALPPEDDAAGSDFAALPPEDAAAGSDFAALPPEDAAAGSDFAALRPGDGATGSDFAALPPEDGAPSASGSDVAALPPEDGAHPAAEGDPEAPSLPVSTRPIDFGPQLVRVAERMRPDVLVRWLEDPSAVTPGTTMPDMRLTKAQVQALAAWLATLGDPTPEEPVDLALAEEGRALIDRYGCAGCHAIPGFEEAGRPGPELTDFGRKDPHDLDFAGRVPPKERSWERFTALKLREPRAFATDLFAPTMPDHALDSADADALAVVLRGLRDDAPPAAYVAPLRDPLRAGRRLAEARNCNGCHAFDGQGADIARFYQGAHLAPPPLLDEGAKVQPQWLLDFLWAPVPLRPWLDARMPRFSLSLQDTRALVAYFGLLADREPALLPVRSRPVTAERAHLGEELFTLLKCASCHRQTATAGIGVEKLAPDLGLAPQRLVPAWVRGFLEDPQASIPGTNMPQFFPDGQTPTKDVLGGDVDAQISLLIEYLMNKGLQPVPADEEDSP